ncbi:MAG TPA: hypothetical protein PLW35_01775, partial [Verrucomicrobiota bacterium]|nr:hypothetical protein [Verrucomicrobiota bacterium]
MTASRFCAGVLLWALGLHASLYSGEWITCHIHERAGVARTGEGVTFGVPLPRAWHATKPTDLRLRREDQAVPAQFEILSRWGSHPADTNAPAKWVLVSYLETLDARSVRAIRIEPGEGLRLVAGEMEKELGHLSSKVTAQAQWMLVPTSDTPAELTFTVHVRSTNSEPNSVVRKITVVAPPKLETSLEG